MNRSRENVMVDMRQKAVKEEESKGVSQSRTVSGHRLYRLHSSVYTTLTPFFSLLLKLATVTRDETGLES